MKKHITILFILCLLQLGVLNVSATKPQAPPSLPMFGRGYSTATDDNGNVYLCGFYQSSSITFGTITLTNTSSGYFDIFIVKYSPAGTVLWAKNVGGSDDDLPRNLTTDQDGNVYVTGRFQSSAITFGSFTLTNTSSGYFDIFIVKYNPAGNVLWAKSAGGSFTDVGTSIITDASGNVYISGTFQSPSITFGSYTFINPAPGNPGTWDTYLVKYDAAGNVLWAKSDWYGSEPGGLATDESGNVYLAGDFNSSAITFGSFNLTNSVTGYYDMYLVKFDAIGNVQWAMSAGGSGDDYAWGIATDGSGNVYLTGSFASSSITFGEITLTNTSGSPDMYIVKYNPSGTILWAKCAVNATRGSNHGRNIATDGSGNAYVTGEFENAAITFGTITLPNSGSADVYLAKYDAGGNVLWAKRAVGSGADVGYGLSTDGSGNAYMSGFFKSSRITFGTITLSNTTGTKGDEDIFLAKYDGNGNVPWATGAGMTTIGKPKSEYAGLNEPNAADITVYPNPTSGKVSLSTDPETHINSISVFNMSGKEILTQQLAAGSSEVGIDLSSQPKGIYIILIKANDNYYQRKIIVE